MLGQPVIETLHVETNDIVTYLKSQSKIYGIILVPIVFIKTTQIRNSYFEICFT